MVYVSPEKLRMMAVKVMRTQSDAKL